MGEIVLRVEGLSKSFGRVPAVQELDFEVRRGEVLGFLGQNGAGKSTTIKMLCNLIRPSAGDAWLDGRSLFNPVSPENRRRMGALVDAPQFYPHLSGQKNLSLLARIHGRNAQRVDTLLEQVGLAKRAQAAFGTYSMGMKQRLGLAAVFLHEPNLIILDEPTSGLDPVGQQQIQTLLRTLAASHGAGILLCTHHLSEVDALCQRALVIEQGRKLLEQDLDSAEALAAVQRCFQTIATEGAA